MIDYLKLSDQIIAGDLLAPTGAYQLASIPESDFGKFILASQKIRRHYFGQDIHTCAICNAKSGDCSENCAYCAQSAHFNCQVESYPLKSAQELSAGALLAAQKNIKRYSLVTSGVGLSNPEIKTSMRALQNVDNIDFCCSYGIIDDFGFQILKKHGISRYHHNLETAPSHFDKVCTTHTIEARIATVKLAKKHGLQVCSGGIFGIGESDAQVVELALLLRQLNVDAVPINFLVAVAGTPLENQAPVSLQRAQKIIAMMRFVLPDKDILICGGLHQIFTEDWHLAIDAGASGIMVGDYLTTKGKFKNLNLF